MHLLDAATSSLTAARSALTHQLVHTRADQAAAADGRYLVYRSIGRLFAVYWPAWMDAPRAVDLAHALAAAIHAGRPRESVTTAGAIARSILIAGSLAAADADLYAPLLRAQPTNRAPSHLRTGVERLLDAAIALDTAITTGQGPTSRRYEPQRVIVPICTYFDAYRASHGYLANAEHLPFHGPESARDDSPRSTVV